MCLRHRECLSKAETPRVVVASLCLGYRKTALRKPSYFLYETKNAARFIMNLLFLRGDQMKGTQEYRKDIKRGKLPEGFSGQTLEENGLLVKIRPW